MSQDFKIDPMFDNSFKARLKRFFTHIINTRYMLIALVLHVVALAIFGGHIIFEPLMSKGNFDSTEQVLVQTSSGPPTPPPPPPPPSDAQEAPSMDTPLRSANSATSRITVSDISQEFTVHSPDVPIAANPDLTIKTETNAKEKMEQAEIARLIKVREFHMGGITGANGVRGATGRGKNVVATFTCYVAKYQGGDWDTCLGTFTEEGDWFGNCIFNLMQQINRWTNGRVKAILKPEILDLGSREWIEKIKPPFIFITGHKDFEFTPEEVTNLREYVMLGGLLWIDNALPGRHSRFDNAVRRELKKVLPDRDFETVDNKHPLFKAFFDFKEPPPGFNFYNEPIEVINIGGIVAVFYTLNDYTEMWTGALTATGNIVKEAVWVPSLEQKLHPSGRFFHSISIDTHIEARYDFYRNLTQPSVVECYRFGINVVIHLLTRFQDKFLSLPKETK